MKKLIALIALTSLIFTFGCTSNEITSDKEDNKNTGSEIVDNQDDKISPDYECISSATAVYAECDRIQTNEISVSLKVGHVYDFAYGRNMDPENSEFNNIALVRRIYGVNLKPGSLLGEVLEENFSEEIVCKIDDYLSDKYDFDTVKRSSDWLTVDKFAIDLNDGIYLIYYDIGVYNDSGEIDYRKLVWGTDTVHLYVEKTGNKFVLYTADEWFMMRTGK